MNKTIVSSLLESKDYEKVALYIKLGFDFTITDLNIDFFGKYGECKNRAFDYSLTGNLFELKKCRTHDILKINDCGYNPLMWSIINHSHDVTKYILNNITNSELYTNTGENLLLLACRFNNETAFNYIVENFQHLLKGLNKKNIYGFNCLHFACNHKNISLIHKILILGDVNVLCEGNIYGANPIHWFMHGSDICDFDKLSKFQMIEKIIISQGHKQILTDMMTARNKINYTPSSWLIDNNDILTLTYIQEKY